MFRAKRRPITESQCLNLSGEALKTRILEDVKTVQGRADIRSYLSAYFSVEGNVSPVHPHLGDLESLANDIERIEGRLPRLQSIAMYIKDKVNKTTVAEDIANTSLNQ